jgi:hypothetical protein
MGKGKETKVESDYLVVGCVYFGFRTTDIAMLAICEECCKTNVHNCTDGDLLFGRSFTLVGLSAKERKCPHTRKKKNITTVC